MKLGFVGLGAMGGALCRRLVGAHDLVVFDRSAAAVQALAAEGAQAATDLAALGAQCDLVVTCLPTSQHVREVIFAEGGLAGSLKPGGIIVDMTTGDPNVTTEMAGRLDALGLTLVDAPVSGGPHGARSGTIAIMVGGPAAVFEALKPVLGAISPNIHHCGEVGTGHAMKLVNNMVSAGVRAITFEAVAMGMKNGLSLETCAKVLAVSSGRSYATEVTLPLLVSGKVDCNFSLGLMFKDVSLATKLGGASSVPMPLGGLVREIYQTGINSLGPESDVNQLIRLYESQSKVEIVGSGTRRSDGASS